MINTIFKRLTGIIFFIIISFILSVLFFFDEIYHFIAEYNPLALLFGLIILIFICYFIYLLLKIDFIRNHNLKILYIITFIIFIVQLFTTYSYNFYAGEDIGMIIRNSNSLATNGLLTDEWYFSTYPNNIFTIFFYSNIIKLLSVIGIYNYYHFILIIIMCLMSAMASILLFKIINNLFNNLFLSWLAYTYYFLLIGISGWLAIFYTDTLALSFPIIILFLYLKINDSKGKMKILYIFLISFVSAIAISIKPQSFIIFIAILIFELFIKENIFRNRIKNIIYLGIGFIIGLQIINFSVSNIRNMTNKESNIGYLHYIKMGLNKDGLGVFYWNDYKESIDIKTKLERDKYNIEIIKNRMSDYTIKSYLLHIKTKTSINFNNGTFGWYWMITDPERKTTHKNTFLTNITKDIYYPEGRYYKYFNFLQQANWLMIILLSFLSIIGKKQYKNMIQLTIIGLFLFVSLFEASSRYLFTNVPIFIICAMYGLDNLINLENKIFNLRTRKQS